jgi:hypothetical protein
MTIQCTINFENHIKFKILAKFGSCLLLNYKKHAKHIFIATDKSGNQAIKMYDRMLWNCSHVLSRPLAHFHFTIYNILI